MYDHKYTLSELRNLQEDEELDLSANGIKDFPNAIVELKRLTTLDLSSNAITFLPNSFCKMTKIIRLDLANNKLHHLPDAIGNLASLQHLSLFGNMLEDLPLSFANLKSLRWLDLGKNPLNPKLLAIAGKCSTEAECVAAAKQVVDVYMGEQKKFIEQQKVQENKLKEKVQKAQQVEKMKKHQEKKQKAAEKNGGENHKEKDAKQRESSGANKNASNQQPTRTTTTTSTHKKETSPKKGLGDQKKTGANSHGFFRKLIGFIFTCFFYLTIIVASSSTVAIGLDCGGYGSPIPGSKPLCKDLTLLTSGQKPSAAFGKNIKNTYLQVLSGYHNQLKPHVDPIQKAAKKQWQQFAKSDFGGKVEKVLMDIHAWVVDKWVKTQRFVVQALNNISAWWKKDGQKQFGPYFEGFKTGMKMVFAVVYDVIQNVAALLVHFASRVKHFFLVWADRGFNAAMNTLNH